MAASERVTITLPSEIVAGIERFERNRSRFIAEAVKRELLRRQREGLTRSLMHPHPEATAVEAQGFSDWADRLPTDKDDLVDPGAGRDVRWVEGTGWIEGS